MLTVVLHMRHMKFLRNINKPQNININDYVIKFEQLYHDHEAISYTKSKFQMMALHLGFVEGRTSLLNGNNEAELL